MTRFRPTIAAVLSWESQVCQYPVNGDPGLGYFAGVVGPDTPPVDCLLWRDEHGAVTGILNHYPVDYPPYETAGNVNIWVHPYHQRQGIGTALWVEALRRWPTISLDTQRFTMAGAAFATRLRQKGLDQ